jgi:hypothetical protein
VGDGEEELAQKVPEDEAKELEGMFSDLPILKLNHPKEWLTKYYTLDQRVAIAKLWEKWKKRKGATWTRKQHADHFQIPYSTLSDWVRDYR